MRRLLTISRSILLINLRRRSTLFWNFAFPVGLILLYGAIWSDQQFGSAQAIAWLAVGVVVLNIMSSGFMGDAGWLAETRQRGILQRIQATPLPPAVLIGAYVLVRMLMVLLQSALIIGVAVLVFGAQFSWGGLALAFALALLGALVFISMGQVIAAFAPNASAAGAIGQAIYFPLMFVSNLFMPAEILPAWLADLARWSPAYMLVDLVRPALVPVPGLQAAWVNVTGLLLYGLVALALAAALFRWEPQR
jgi:ABC-2 type transport system permease protein